MVHEEGSAALTARLDAFAERGDDLVSSTLLETELRRLAVRWDLSQAEVTDVLQLFDIFTPDRALFSEAGLLPGRHLRSLDALHLAMALRLAAEVMITYDHGQADSAHAVGLEVLAP
jgi:hypothetical protein